ncbi:MULTISPECIES: hypothetical protein [unclassified Sphingomonas]|uniref:hypothetical protein n=1 Tax=unclassified Sphingomonas TaxID=196159 RepID=UPI0006FB1EF2|nr:MULTISPECIES: hypothetical protein [unclassified Sphingomonas]KQM28799.1 hypothetical protein ASE58_02735 [Sphingomonas sp. Leaf9]KQM45500.1 hypothetical protein ASE57_02725 [Sphingomonas sp. Leaf11]
MTAAFVDRMRTLDSFAAQCRDSALFATAVVRDTSNRTGRDWPWWGLRLERTDLVDLEYRRVSAEIRLDAPAPGTASMFKGRWSARIWREASTDSFRADGDRMLPWEWPSAPELLVAFGALLGDAERAIREVRPAD